MEDNEVTNNSEDENLVNILSRMSSSLSLDVSNCDDSLPESLEDPRAKKIIPVEREDGAMSKLFIYPSPHVLSEAEQILLEYLDQPKSKTASKCKYSYKKFSWIIGDSD